MSLTLREFWPIQNSLHFVFSHAESIRGKDISEVFHTVPVEHAFMLLDKAMLPESAEDFFNMLFVLGHIIRVNQDVIKVDDDTNIKEVTKDVVHELLKSYRGIGKSEGHHQPFK
jgi:hypothetical protein